MQEILRQLVAGQTLSESEAERALETILTGGANETQIGAFLAFLASRGPTADELIGSARVMRRHVTGVPTDVLPSGARVIDTCGTGGAPKTFNISTAAALIAAAIEAPNAPVVAKHGGRSRSGRGSAEVLEKLGVNIDASPETQARCLREARVCFSFAIQHHPAMKHAAGPRKSLGFPTIFNLLGPLTNPAGARRQLLGVYDAGYAQLMADALNELGCERAMVAHGADGLDELTTTGPTQVWDVQGGRVKKRTVDPESLGLVRVSLADIQQAGDLDGAARLIRSILDGEAGPPREIAVLNAAGAAVVAGACDDLRGGIELSKRAIDSGAAAHRLEQLAQLSHEDS